MAGVLVGQLGGPVHGHDHADGGVDPPGAVLMFLGQPGAPRISLEDSVGDMPGQGRIIVVDSGPSTISA
jgi:hypothetical protein